MLLYFGLRKTCIRRRQWHPTPVLLPGESHGQRSLVGCSPWGANSQTRLSDFTFTFHFHALEKEMATHSSVLAWRIPGTGEPGGLPSMGLHKVGHDWSDLASVAWRISWTEEPARLWSIAYKESDMTQVTQQLSIHTKKYYSTVKRNKLLTIKQCEWISKTLRFMKQTLLRGVWTIQFCICKLSNEQVASIVRKNRTVALSGPDGWLLRRHIREVSEIMPSDSLMWLKSTYLI